MNGIAKFILKKPNELYYREDGVLTIGQSFNAHREYLYCYRENEISVFFVENMRPTKLLHTLEFVSNGKDGNLYKATARHLCIKDIYSAVYLFRSNQFHLKYTVIGANKNFTITTLFHRIE